MRTNYTQMLIEWKEQLQYCEDNLQGLDREINKAMINLLYAGYLPKNY